MVPRGKERVAKPDDLSLIPGTYMMGRSEQNPSLPLTSKHMHVHAWALTHTRKYFEKIKYDIIIMHTNL